MNELFFLVAKRKADITKNGRPSQASPFSLVDYLLSMCVFVVCSIFSDANVSMSRKLTKTMS